MSKRQRKQKKKVNPTSRRLVELAERFRRARIWRKIKDSQLILIDIDSDDGRWVATVLGNAGIEEGLAIQRGSDAYAAIATAYDTDDHDPGFMGALDSLVLGYGTLRELSPEFRRVLTQAGIPADGSRLVPVLSAKDAHSHPRPLRQAEIRTLTAALAGILSCHDDGSLAPVACHTDREHIFQIRVDRSGKRIEAGLIDLPDDFRRVQVADQITLPEEFRELPLIDTCYLLTVVPMSAKIHGDPRSVSGIFVLDASRESILNHRTGLGECSQDVVALLTSTFRGETPESCRGLPRVLIFDHRQVFDGLCASLTDLGIEAIYDPDHPGYAHFRESLAGFSADAEDAAAPPADPKTLAEWKGFDLWVTQSYVAGSAEIDTKRARKRFFGAEEIPEQAMEVFGEEAVRGSYIEWLIADYRSTVRSKTYVEKMLERPELTEAEITIYESRRDAKLSLYQIVEVVPGVSLVVQEALARQRHTVHDGAMAVSEHEGHWLFLRLYSIKAWTFPGVAGPLLSARGAEEVLQWCDDTLDTDEPEVLRRHSHLIGNLWIPHSERARQRPVLQNTDGEPLELLTALFSVENPGSLTDHLGAREDLEAVDDAEWTWLSGRSGPMGSVTQGRLELIGDELVVEVNSRARLTRAQEWLEQIPGVRYIRDRAQSLDPDDLPLDARSGPPPPLPPEVVEQIIPQLRRQLLGWVDESIPMLDGMTPRDACSTARGRKKVLRMLQTMPEPVVQEEFRKALDFQSIRNEMLRELGLEH